MAIYMKLDKLDKITGAATVPDISGKKGLFVVGSINWGAGRPINIQVGSSTNAETGSVSISDVSISRACDGASPYLQTYFFQPGGKGRTVDFLITKSDRAGSGLIPSMIVTIEEARMTSYMLNASGAPSEDFSLAFTSLAVTHYTEEDDGTVKKGDTIKFDLATAKLVSSASLPAG